MSIQATTATAAALLIAAHASGGASTEQFDLPTANLAIFGVQFTADYLGPAQGFITETRVQLNYSNPGPLDAADLIIQFQAPSDGVPVWQLTGADLGWSGTGSFNASLSTDTLNGPIDLGDPPPDFSLFFLSINAQGFQPLSGQFTSSFFQVDIAPGGPPDADVNGDGAVDVDDLVEVILTWGQCDPPPAPCPTDINGDLRIDVDDLVEVILGWTG